VRRLAKRTGRSITEESGRLLPPSFSAWTQTTRPGSRSSPQSNLLAAASDVRLSAVTDHETSVVLRPRRRAMIERYDALLAEIGVSIVTFDEEQSRLAFDGYRRWGKGVHPAALNLGGCAAYALATSLDPPLLFKGDGLPEDRCAARAIAISSPRT
jgi:ribonuclease VapC